MRIECIAVGTELLATERIDTNSVWLAQRLARLGLGFHRKTCVGDSRQDLADLFREALDRSDLVLTTGGLGPTFDDFTKEVLAEIAGAPLREDAACKADLLAFYASRNRVPSENNLKQVLIPEGAEPVRNPLGTAPGIWWEAPAGRSRCTVVMMPGVPREMKRMWLDQVEPRLAARAGATLHTLRVVVGGVPESTLDERTRVLRERHAELDWTILAGIVQVELQARHTDPAALASAEADLRDLLGPDLVCVGDANLEDEIVRLLQSRDETLAVAESMPGGLLCAKVTSVPGASRVLKGGGVTYTADAKTVLAGVDPGLIAAHGTVSEPVTHAMAEGIRQKLAATWGLAVTGNAGPALDPQGATSVGDCIVALTGPDTLEIRRFSIPGERPDIQLRGAAWALDLLRRSLI
ncbi:MAG TPA: CinA family nicotinamide mononucleotide deamidase-related protein [Holophagaceae bacterium]|nr:CinA family nicotinamide mononucleotide deamidase-related protein [Holophagaceae bacterium]